MSAQLDMGKQQYRVDASLDNTKLRPGLHRVSIYWAGSRNMCAGRLSSVGQVWGERRRNRMLNGSRQVRIRSCWLGKGSGA